MCKECGKKEGKKKNGQQRGKRESVQKTKKEEPCKFCGGVHQKEELVPYTDPFPQIPPFPPQGIYGMYPIRSTCKREIMDHMVRFERELMAQAEKAKMRVKMLELKSRQVQKDTDSTSRVVNHLDQLEADIQQLKHELTVESLRRKYGVHADGCPCQIP